MDNSICIINNDEDLRDGSGRGNVCTLYEKGVSIPSDFSGVTYISLENSWEMKLIQYLQKRGFSIKF